MTATEQMTNDLAYIDSVTGESGRQIDVYQGYNDWIVEQLPEKSNEEAILRECPRDAASRFSTPEHFGKWVVKGEAGRTLYPGLDHETGELGLLVWLGQEAFAGKDYQILSSGNPTGELLPGIDPITFAATQHMTDTFAIRAYKSHQGDRFSRRFMRIATDAYITQELETERTGNRNIFHGIHSETNISNLDSTYLHVNLYGEGEGYLPTLESVKNNRRAFIYPRQLMRQHVGIDLRGIAG
jgi:hypothetical protein